MTPDAKTLPNVIFLDMDGPLCTPRACLATGNIGMYSYLDPIACLLVRKLCEENNAKLVISSAWRLEFNREAMEAILSANCPRLGEYIWRSHEWWCTSTYILPGDEFDMTSDRGREIQHWIQNNSDKFNNFCIIDDMADMRPLQDSLVKCDVYEGMGWKQFHEAEALLKAVA